MPLPDPLVTIREYASADLAADDLQRLTDAGVTAYLGGGQFHEEPRGPTEILVPEHQVERANAILGPELPRLFDVTEKHKAQLRCPWCGASSITSRRPYALIAFLVSVGLIALSATRDHLFAGLAAAGATMTVAFFIESHVPRWRCNMCGTKWGTDAVDQ